LLAPQRVGWLAGWLVGWLAGWNIDKACKNIRHQRAVFFSAAALATLSKVYP